MRERREQRGEFSLGNEEDARKRKDRDEGERALPQVHGHDDAAAELIQSTISAAAPDDPKALRAITGALKDLKDLIDEPPGAAKDGGEIVIRVEGDAPEAP